MKESNSVVAPVRLRSGLNSGLRQSGTHPSSKKPRDEWGTRSGCLGWRGVVTVDKFEDGAVGGYVFGRLDCHERCDGKVGEIHDRQPVILEPREYGEWLAESERPPVIC